MPAHAAIDVQYFTRDVTRPRRCQEQHGIGHVLWFAKISERDVVTSKLIAICIAGIDAIDDLFADDTARRERVDRDRELSNLAREPFRPCINRGNADPKTA